MSGRQGEGEPAILLFHSPFQESGTPSSGILVHQELFFSTSTRHQTYLALLAEQDIRDVQRAGPQGQEEGAAAEEWTVGVSAVSPLY